MTKKALCDLVTTTSEETLSLLNSMKGVLTLMERTRSTRETHDYVSMLSTCVTKLEQIALSAKNKIQSEN